MSNKTYEDVRGLRNTDHGKYLCEIMGMYCKAADEFRKADFKGVTLKEVLERCSDFFKHLGNAKEREIEFSGVDKRLGWYTASNFMMSVGVYDHVITFRARLFPDFLDRKEIELSKFEIDR